MEEALLVTCPCGIHQGHLPPAMPVVHRDKGLSWIVRVREHGSLGKGGGNRERA